MKRTLFFLAGAAALIAGCSAPEGYVLTGEVPEAWEGKPVVLYTADAGALQAVDSTKVADGGFRFAGRFEQPRRCVGVVYLDPGKRDDPRMAVDFTVWLDSTAVAAVCDASQRDPVWSVTGGALQSRMETFRKADESLAAEQSRAFAAYTRAFYNDDDPQRGIELARRVTEKRRQRNELAMRTIAEDPRSVAGLSLLQELCDTPGELERAELAALFDGLSPEVRESEAGRYTGEKVRGKRMLVGEPLPDVELDDADGASRRLKECLRPGHVTLIELWASWCMPCRGDMPYVKQAYDLYRSRGFDIVSISVDRDEARWREALAEERMPWLQLRDSGSRCFGLFETTGVPTAILVDGEGRIIHLNARGGWLFGALREIYGR